MSKNDGGNAFPYSALRPDGFTTMYADSEGISLRDYFAAKANIEVYAPVDTLYRTLGRNPTVDEMAAWIADVRFIEADAMIRRRAIDTGEISE